MVINDRKSVETAYPAKRYLVVHIIEKVQGEVTSGLAEYRCSSSSRETSFCFSFLL
jgi:hypothetical protein